jgi:steroid 5-alpha reductase family enzyme
MSHDQFANLAMGLSINLAVVALMMTAAFIASRIFGRNCVVDVFWPLGFVAVAIASFLWSAKHGGHWSRLTLLALVAVWGLRLAAHLGLRMRGEGEDPRYLAIMRGAKGNQTLYAIRMIYLLQGVIMYIVSIAIAIAMVEGKGLWPLLVLGAIASLKGIAFETIGDWQLKRFKAEPANAGQVMDRGLWHYTRHPNYFGDALFWWGIAIMALRCWPGFLALPSVALMTFMLTSVSGKPLLERGMKRTRPGYAEYVARTSGFFPWFPKAK